MTVALTTHKAMSLSHKFDENMKGDNKLLITETTFGYVCFVNLLVEILGQRRILYIVHIFLVMAATSARIPQHRFYNRIQLELIDITKAAYIDSTGTV